MSAPILAGRYSTVDATAGGRYLSPLRYPGGKGAIARHLAEVFNRQVSYMPIEIWLEPFAGGAGAALHLLHRGVVDEAWLIEANPAIAAFWTTVREDGARLADCVAHTVPTLQLWHEAQEVLAAPTEAGTFDLAYAAFIVNRCSRSGIVAPRSGIMGGLGQNGDWSLGDRFNAPVLADRILHIAALGRRLLVVNADGIDYIEQSDESGVGDELVMFVDPPYIREGSRLYKHGMDGAGHERIAAALNTTHARWILTYDNHPDVAGHLYPERRIVPFSIRNTANRARVATELAVLSDNLDVETTLFDATPDESTAHFEEDRV